ncbi:DNA glycosylase AlkZ-like family protein [Nakamurella aerolata]|uniref:Winged helix-turn-helix domain-containing protein n=1 Tax=Nakamurella aerolata TaxID=1656892 RepID=A0A849A1D9_9ACTN|nr:crosslink repair DNA glycosylase YcaQ family protein [Nakamurella aerolata]NNG34449.1 winged helix-turn-helix domain-containing protein [Nakamurella aerolata]
MTKPGSAAGPTGPPGSASPPLRLSKRDARRTAIRAQALQRQRPDDLEAVLRQLFFLQLEPTKAVAPSAELVLWSRLGNTFRPEQVDEAIADGRVVEYRGTLRLAADMALFRADMAAWPGLPPLRPWQEIQAEWVDANDACRRDILHRLETEGPLPTGAFPDICEVPWKSSGWTNNRNVSQLLNLMVQRGEVAIAGHQAGERMWDLAERVYPDGPTLPLEQAAHERNKRRLTALGIARASGQECVFETTAVGEVGVPAEVAGVSGLWRVDPELLDQPFRGRAALLSPFDRLVFDRRRVAELFDYEYILEMYKPAAKRRWGYYALPVLYGDKLVGKLDATADHKSGVLRVNALHWDQAPSAALRAAVDREIDALGAWLGLPVQR